MKGFKDMITNFIVHEMRSETEALRDIGISLTDLIGFVSHLVNPSMTRGLLKGHMTKYAKLYSQAVYSCSHKSGFRLYQEPMTKMLVKCLLANQEFENFLKSDETVRDRVTMYREVLKINIEWATVTPSI